MSGIEIATIGSTAITLGDAALVAGTAISAFSMYQQSNQAAAMAKYNAQVDANRAIEARQVADEQERRSRETARRMLASQRAAIGASGADVGTGSALLAQADSAAGTELDALTIRHSGSAEAARARASETLQRYEAAQYRSNRFFGPAATLLTGASKLGQRLGS